MATIVETFQKRNFFPSRPAGDDLPISQKHSNDSEKQGLRRRIASFSFKIQPIASSSSYSWAFKKSKSMSSVGEMTGNSLKKWWNWSWSWILSRKPVFIRDLEMNEEESSILGHQNKGSWRHILYKVKFELRRLVNPNSVSSTGKKFGYDLFSYQKNFDDGGRTVD